MKKLLACFVFILIFGCLTPENKIFHYQLQDATFDELRELDVSVLIVDKDDSRLTKDEIGELQKSGKIVLSYLSIGEAEDYRDYWEDGWETGNPKFIGKENPEWKGNYEAMYWEPEWQNIILVEVQEITDLGYDGIYLDKVDAYQDFKEQGKENADKEMIEFVAKIRKKAYESGRQFLIVPQNAEELYKFKEYQEIIDGIGKEDTWFNDDEKKESAIGIEYLDKILNDKKLVLAIDYPETSSNICEFYQECDSHGFYCTVSNRELDLDRLIRCSR